MTLIQKFNPEVCFKANCDKLNFGACFGNLEKCKINKKAGYPKEVK